IGNVDDCQLCGAQFLMSSSIREQIEELETEAANQKREAEAERRNAKRIAREERHEALAEKQRDRQRLEDERGYDYPNLRKYQLSIERTAIAGAALLCVLAAAALIFGIASASNHKMALIEVAALGLSVVSCLVSAAAWYFWWMIVAEML